MVYKLVNLRVGFSERGREIGRYLVVGFSLVFCILVLKFDRRVFCLVLLDGK